MAATALHTATATERPDQSLNLGALGVISSTVVGVASVTAACGLAATLGLVVHVRPAFFRTEVPNRDIPILVPEDIGTPVGLFGVDPNP